MYGNVCARVFPGLVPLPAELTGLCTAGWDIVKLMCQSKASVANDNDDKWVNKDTFVLKKYFEDA